MNRITKVLSSLVAAVTLAVSVGSVASATTYDPCDVNYDGVVNIRDSAAVKKYLEGNLKHYNYYQFDTNRSYIVDNADIQYIQAKISGKTVTNKYYSRENNTTYPNTANPSPFTPDESGNNPQKRKYRRYSYISKAELQEYNTHQPKPLQIIILE